MYAQTLQGSYTIGSGGNYTTIASAMSALTTNGYQEM
jgi:ATP-dependent protease HslVU (ClpYQ) peptidase subunit